MAAWPAPPATGSPTWRRATRTRVAPTATARARTTAGWRSPCVPDDEWRRLCAAMDRQELAHDPRFSTLADRKRNEEALDAEIATWTRQRTRFEAAERLR